MVKADAYGHGMEECALATESIVDYFGVAYADEGIKLRRFTDKPILITACSPQDFAKAVRFDLEPTLYELDALHALQQECEKLDKTCRIHLKLDTGMNRLGVKEEKELLRFLSLLRCCPNILLAGVMSHIGDPLKKREYKARFDSFLELIKQQGFKDFIAHLAASSTLIESEYGYDMVRAGLCAYGADENFLPVMRVYSEVLCIKRANKGECVGYSGVPLKKDTVLAIISCGYGDGFLRFNKGGKVLANGKEAEIVGNVCMDMTAIDVSGLNVQTGDRVVLLGEMDSLRLSAQDLAERGNTIPYEIFTSFHGRIDRIFYG